MNELKSGAALNYAVILLNIIVGLLYTPYMLRALGQSEYGMYSLVASVISCLTVLDLGLGNAVVRYTAHFRADGRAAEIPRLLGMFLAMYIGVGVLSMVCGGVLYVNFDGWFAASMTPLELHDARLMLLLLVANVAFTFPMSVFGSVLAAYERFVFPRVLQIARIVLSTALMVVLLSLGFKALALVVVQTLFNVAVLCAQMVYARSHLGVRIRFRGFDKELLRQVAVYSFWVFLSVVMDRIYWSTGQMVLAFYDGTAQVAVFAVAIQLSLLYMTFSTAISGVFLPRLTTMVAQCASDTEMSRLFLRTGRIQYMVMALVLSGFVVFGRNFVYLWAGTGYDDTYLITLIFFFALTIPMIQNVGIGILQARNRLKFRSLLYLLIASISLLMQFLLAPQYGGVGVACAIAGALLVGQGVAMNLYYHYRQKLDIQAFWRSIGRMSVVPLLMSIGATLSLLRVSLSTWGGLCLAICVYLCVYVPLFWRWSMNGEERAAVRAIIRKRLPI